MAPVTRLKRTSNPTHRRRSLHGHGRKLKWVLGGCLAALTSNGPLVDAQEPFGAQGMLDIHSLGGK